MAEVQSSFNIGQNISQKNKYNAKSLFCLWGDWIDAGGSICEGVPLALDTGTVCVEGFTNADDVQSWLVGQLGYKFCNFLWCFVGDRLLLHITIHCTDQITNKMFFLHFKTPNCKRLVNTAGNDKARLTIFRYYLWNSAGLRGDVNHSSWVILGKVDYTFFNEIPGGT